MQARKRAEPVRLVPIIAFPAALMIALGGAGDLARGQDSETDEAMVAGAVLQGLDKTTARVSTFSAPIDDVVAFGTLQIVVRRCDKTPPTEPPESAAFIEIVDARPDSPAVPVFTGWMFASSPAVSALEHPVYDIWVIDCRKGAAEEQG
jgi:hypothetical protein